MSILFKNVGILLRKENKYEAIKNGYLGIDGKCIDYIGQDAPNKKYDEEKDYTNKLLMPGLVNAHTHTPMVFMRGIGNGHTLQEWLNDVIFPIENKMTKEQIRASSYYAIMELLASGVTSFTDMYFFSEETADAVINTGIKANLNKYILCFDENQKIEDSMISISAAYVDKYNGLADGRLKADFSIHAEYTNKPHIVEAYSKLCKEKKVNMHIHLSETKSEHDACVAKYGKTPARWFYDLGTFDSPTNAAHCVWVTPEDMELLKEKNVSITHCPSSNFMLGSGYAPVRTFLDKGINVALGTDGAASNNNLNLFEEMHLVDLVHNGINHDPLNVLSKDVIDMATINGAKAQGRFDTGVLEVGKKADICAIDLDKVHLYPIFDPQVILTFSAQASDVCMTMVDGKILYENGKYLTIDADKVKYEFKQVVKEFYKSWNTPLY